MMAVPAARVRALTDEMRVIYASNSLSAGFWKWAPLELGGGEFRLVNNTITCEGPWLVIFRETPPSIAWAQMPPDWEEDGFVRMAVAKGTLVPIAELSVLKRKRRPSEQGSSFPVARLGKGEAVLPAMLPTDSTHLAKMGISTRPVMSAPPLLTGETPSALQTTCLPTAQAMPAVVTPNCIPAVAMAPLNAASADAMGWAYRSSSTSEPRTSSAPASASPPPEGAFSCSTPSFDGCTPPGCSSPVPSSVASSTGGEPDCAVVLSLTNEFPHHHVHSTSGARPESGGATGSTEASAPTPARLLANLRNHLFAVRDSTLAVLKDTSGLAVGQRRGAYEAMAARFASDIQQVEVWMVEMATAAQRGGGNHGQYGVAASTLPSTAAQAAGYTHPPWYALPSGIASSAQPAPMATAHATAAPLATAHATMMPTGMQLHTKAWATPGFEQTPAPSRYEQYPRSAAEAMMMPSMPPPQHAPLPRPGIDNMAGHVAGHVAGHGVAAHAAARVAGQVTGHTTVHVPPSAAMSGTRSPFLPMPFIAPSSTNPGSAPPPLPLPAGINAARLSTLAGDLDDEVRARAFSSLRHGALSRVWPAVRLASHRRRATSTSGSRTHSMTLPSTNERKRATRARTRATCARRALGRSGPIQRR